MGSTTTTPKSSNNNNKSSSTIPSNNKSSPSSSSSATTKPHALGTIPVIDLAGTFGSGPSVTIRRKEVAKIIDRTCRDIGFFTIINHGIEEKNITQFQKITTQYFDLPESEKNKIPMDKDYPYGNATMQYQPQQIIRNAHKLLG